MPRSLPVLVVEDVPMAQMVAKMLLTGLGHAVDIAADGPEAVSRFEQNQYDFIFMDMGLPVFDGLEATRRIRQLEQRPSYVPIVALTANYEDSNKKACLASGMDDFLPKPLTKAMTIAMLERFVFSQF